MNDRKNDRNRKMRLEMIYVTRETTLQPCIF